jgi:rhamnose transport system permease protein
VPELSRVLEWARTRSWELLLAAILLATIAYNASQSDVYLDVDNFVNIFQLSIEKVIVAVVMTFVIVNGEIDLSVASVMAFSASLLAVLHDGGTVPFPLAIALAILAGALAGLLQGLIVAKTGLPSLVVTLAGLIGFRGAARILLEDRSIGGSLETRFPDWFGEMGREDFLGRLPFPLVFFLVLLFVGAIVLHRSAFGRTVYVVGDNAEVARFSGIDVVRHKVTLFVMSGTVAGIAGVLFAARLGSVRANIGEGYELDIITMVLLGGVSIFGGSGSLRGVALAICIVLNVRNGLGLNNVDGSTQTGVIGALLILSVLARNQIDRFTAPRPARTESPSQPSAEAASELAHSSGNAR